MFLIFIVVSFICDPFAVLWLKKRKEEIKKLKNWSKSENNNNLFDSFEIIVCWDVETIICWNVETIICWNVRNVSWDVDDWFDEIIRIASDVDVIKCTGDVLIS